MTLKGIVLHFIHVDKHQSPETMEQQQLTTTETPSITALAFVSAYVDDFNKAYEFYTNLLGLTKKYDMGDEACFFGIGEHHGLYLEGGHRGKADRSNHCPLNVYTNSLLNLRVFYEAEGSGSNDHR